MGTLTIQDLGALLQRRDSVMARNNAAATRSPRFAGRLYQSRLDPRHAQANLAVARAYNAASQGLQGWEVAAIGSVVGLAVVVAVTLVLWQIRSEERAYAAEHPFQATFETASNTVLWLVLGGVVVIGGLVYWDYRSQVPQLSTSRASTARPRSRPLPSLADLTRTRVDPEMEERMAEEYAIQQAFERAETKPMARRPSLGREAWRGF